ncbi:MAG: hypothetical protein RLY70_4237 [Planctomycetota bacterium]|jgi:hypothetical protein
MACDWFERRLQQVLDARRDPAADERLAGHASHCPDCAEWLDANQLLLATVRRRGANADGGVQRRASLARPMRAREFGIATTATIAEGRGGPVVTATVAITVAALLLVMLVAAPRSPEADSAKRPLPTGWRATVAEWSAASGRWLAANFAPSHSEVALAEARVAGESGLGEAPAWGFHWMARVGYSLASTEAPPVEQMEQFAGTIRPLATSMYRVVETLRPKWQPAHPPLTPERERTWNRLDAEPRAVPSGSGERNSRWEVERTRMV